MIAFWKAARRTLGDMPSRLLRLVRPNAGRRRAELHGAVESPSTYIKCSPEVIEQLKTWSEPVQVRAERYPDGEWSLIFRLCNAQSPERVFYEIMSAREGLDWK